MVDISQTVFDHISGGTHEMGFYIFLCPKCKNQWAIVAADPRLWLDGDVANVRWVDPVATCKCGERVSSGDSMWCPDPGDMKRKRIRAWVEERNPLVAGILPRESFALNSEGVIPLRVRVRKYTTFYPGPEGGASKMDMWDYRLFDGQNRWYNPLRSVPGVLVRSDGTICIWARSTDHAAYASTDYTEAIDFAKTDASPMDEYKEAVG